MKKRIWMSVFLISVLCLISTCVSAEDELPTYRGFARVLMDSVKLREKPNGDRLGYLSADEIVYVADKEVDKNGVIWFRVYATNPQRAHWGDFVYGYHGYVKEGMLALLSEIAPNVVAFDVFNHLVVVHADGRVEALGPTVINGTINGYDVAGWQDIVEVKTHWNASFGLTSDGMVRATGHNIFILDGLREITGLSSGERTYVLNREGRIGQQEFHVTLDYFSDEILGTLPPLHQVVVEAMSFAAIAKDGGVIRFGFNPYGECDIDKSWAGITQIEVGSYHTVGLKPDGTVLAIGNNELGQCDVQAWKDIQSIATGRFATYGVCRDGTVVMAGTSDNTGPSTVNEWQDVVEIAVGNAFVVGLTKNGQLLMSGEPIDAFVLFERDERIERIDYEAVGLFNNEENSMFNDAAYHKEYRPEDIIR